MADNRKSVGFSFICEIFMETGISPNWLYALNNGVTSGFTDGIVNVLDDGETVFINSGTRHNLDFDRDMLRYIRQVINENEDKNIIIQSTNEGIARHMAKKGFTYNGEFKMYMREKK